MSYVTSGILGATAAVLALGAVHLEVAAGHDGLGAAQRGDASVFMLARANAETIGARGFGFAAQGPAGPGVVINVDRSAKGDREAASTPLGGLTLSFKVPSLPETSVLMRVPAGDTADALRKAPAITDTGKELSKGKESKGSDQSSAGPRPVACEPVVSVLTAVAKQLEAGRCVT